MHFPWAWVDPQNAIRLKAPGEYPTAVLVGEERQNCADWVDNSRNEPEPRGAIRLKDPGEYRVRPMIGDKPDWVGNGKDETARPG